MSSTAPIRAALAAAALLFLAVPARAEGGAVPLLFRVVGPRDDVMIGLTPAELEAAGPAAAASPVDYLARKLVADGQLSAWRYAVGRAPDGTTRLAAIGRVAILRNDALRLEPYRPALPVAAPAAEP